MAENVKDELLDWDSEIEDDSEGGQAVILEEGDYEFEVTEFTRGRFNGSTKIPACNRAELVLTIKTDKGNALCWENLLLVAKLEWKMSAFFRSIGQKEHGQKLKPDWSKVLGAKGKAHFKPEEYTTNSGETRKKNTLTHYIDMTGKSLNVNVDEEEEVPFGK